MKLGWIATGALMLGMLVGCGSVEVNEEPAIEVTEASGDRAEVSPELLDAVLAKAPRSEDEWLHAAACPAAKTCPGAITCGNWSNLANCGLTACNATDGSCRVCDAQHNCQYRGGQKQLRSRSRQCTTATGTCTEIQIVNNQPSVCGCFDL